MTEKSVDSLFNELRKNNPDIYLDGIVDAEKYGQAKYKIVYVLKELNAPSSWEVKDLRWFLRKVYRPQTWNNIARWTEGIFNIDHDYSWDEMESYDKTRQQKFIRQIAAINLKKTPGTHTSNNNEIHNGAYVYKDLLLAQIKEYDPDIIIACGTSGACSQLNYFSSSEKINWKRTHNGIDYYIEDGLKKHIFISFAHPEARVGSNYLYYILMDAVREILSEREKNK